MAEVKFPLPSVWVDLALETVHISPPVLKLELTPAQKRERFVALADLSGYFGKKKAVQPAEGEPAAGAEAPKEGPEEDAVRKEEASREMDVFFDRFTEIVMSHVVGWDLTLRGEPISCTKEEKAKWLEPLLWDSAKLLPEKEREEEAEEDDVKKAKPRWLWLLLIEFISTPRNFLKN